MKRYWLFIFSEYYPSGGVGDLTHLSDDLEALIGIAKKLKTEYNNWHVFDAHKLIIIESSYSDKPIDDLEITVVNQ